MSQHAAAVETEAASQGTRNGMAEDDLQQLQKWMGESRSFVLGGGG